MEIHHEVEIEQEVEVPTFSDQRITQDVLQLHSIDVLVRRQISDFGKLELRGNMLGLARDEVNIVPVLQNLTVACGVLIGPFNLWRWL